MTVENREASYILDIPDVVNLPSVALAARMQLPNIAAVYFAVDAASCILYVGRAKALCFRWQSHHLLHELRNMPDVRIAYLAVDNPDDLPHLEKVCIDYFVPSLNRLHKRQSKSESTTYKSTLLRLPESLLESCKEVAQKEHRSLNNQLLTIIEEWLLKYPCD
jgi:excinuclease UvrABC nuclease subunit